MRRAIKWGALWPLLLLLAVFSAPSASLRLALSSPDAGANYPTRPAAWGRGNLQFVQGYAVVHLRGSAAERGEQFGRLTGPGVRFLLRHYLGPFLGEGAAAARLDARRAAAHVSPSLVEEVQGIARGAELDYEDVLLAHSFLDSYPDFHCTTFAARGPATPDGRMRVARNLDFPPMGLLHRFNLVAVHHPEDGAPFALLTWPGQCGGITGFNAHGVFLAMMVSLDGERGGAGRGEPTVLLFRRALERARTARDVLQVVREARRANSANLMVADAQEALVLEITPSAVAVRERAADGTVFAANYFRSPELERTEPCRRYVLMQELGAPLAVHGGLDVAALQGILGQVRMAGINVQAMVFEPETLRLHLAMGSVPASDGPYRTLDFRAIFQEFENPEDR